MKFHSLSVDIWRLILHFWILQNWFHLKSKWQKKIWNFHTVLFPLETNSFCSTNEFDFKRVWKWVRKASKYLKFDFEILIFIRDIIKQRFLELDCKLIGIQNGVCAADHKLEWFCLKISRFLSAWLINALFNNSCLSRNWILLEKGNT